MNTTIFALLQSLGIRKLISNKRVQLPPSIDNRKLRFDAVFTSIDNA